MLILDNKLWLSHEKFSVMNALSQGFLAENECLWQKVMVMMSILFMTHLQVSLNKKNDV